MGSARFSSKRLLRRQLRCSRSPTGVRLRSAQRPQRAIHRCAPTPVLELHRAQPMPYLVLVYRFAASLHASLPRSVALSPLRFASFAVVNSWSDLHPQDCAHAARKMKKPHDFRHAAFFMFRSSTKLPWQMPRSATTRRGKEASSGGLPRLYGDHVTVTRER